MRYDLGTALGHYLINNYVKERDEAVLVNCGAMGL